MLINDMIPYHILLYFVGTVLSISFVVVVYNFFTATKLQNKRYALQKSPLVSILIPARNEEDTISGLLNSISQQSYCNYELFVLDDQSEDNTAGMVEGLMLNYPKITLVRGEPLPEGWVGKNWACFQLAQHARGEIVLFLDADVRLSVNALNAALYHMQNNNVVMLSCFPTQKIDSLGEWVVVPLMNWLVLSFLPLRTVTRFHHQSLTAANGQLILCDREAYNDIGGHRAVFDQVVEDMEIARRLKKKKYRIMTVLGNEAIYCCMYQGLVESIKGFSKNFYLGFNVSPGFFFSILVLLMIVFCGPFILIAINTKFIYCLLLILVGRLLVSLLSKQNPLFNIFLHPLQMIAMFIVGVNSLYWTLKGKTVWKGRSI
jgi:chlorobactene glucosyltransferase